MAECPAIFIRTLQELDRAILNYRNSDLSGFDLFCQWQAIRNASLALLGAEFEADRVPGEDSY